MVTLLPDRCPTSWFRDPRLRPRRADWRAGRPYTTLPWVMVPTMLVSLYLLVHLTSAVKLRSWRRPTYAVAVAQ